MACSLAANLDAGIATKGGEQPNAEIHNLEDELHVPSLLCMQLIAKDLETGLGRGMPVRYPRTTNSTGKTRQRRMMDTLGSGTASSALGAICCVSRIHHALVWFSTCPCSIINVSSPMLRSAAASSFFMPSESRRFLYA